MSRQTILKWSYKSQTTGVSNNLFVDLDTAVASTFGHSFQNKWKRQNGRGMEELMYARVRTIHILCARDAAASVSYAHDVRQARMYDFAFLNES